MSSHDISIGVIAAPSGAPTLNKPKYLIAFNVADKRTREPRYFLSMDKPDLLNGFIQVKGFFVDLSDENEIISSFSDLLTSTAKELYLDIMFPWHKIAYVRSLTFKAK